MLARLLRIGIGNEGPGWAENRLLAVPALGGMEMGIAREGKGEGGVLPEPEPRADAGTWEVVIEGGGKGCAGG